MKLIKHSAQYLDDKQSSAENIILRTVEKYRNFLAPTYGPAGKQILIADSDFSVKAVDDGKMASSAFNMTGELGEFAQAVVNYIHETTAKTEERVGDGTTTSALIMAEIVKQAFGDIQDKYAVDKKSVFKMVKELRKALPEAIEQIKAQAKPISTQEELYKIAYNSYNNEEVAKLISEALFKIGQSGSLTIEDSKTAEHSVEAVKGLEIAKGYKSPYFINNEKQESVIKNPYVLLVNERIEFFKDMMPIIKQLVEAGRKDIVIIAEAFGDDAMGGMIVNKMRGLSPVLVETPGYGDTKPELLKDIASVVGGMIVDSKAGLKLSDIKLDQMGTCETVIAKKDKTLIVGGNGNVNERLETLNLFLEAASKYEKDQLERRIASLSGGVAVLKIGANTEQEQKTIKAKAEDAVSATREAFKSGVVKGAGITFSSITTSSDILNNALKAPRKQLEENGAEFLDNDVVDPAGVLIAALESAVSIGCGLINTGGISAEEKKKDED